MRNLKGLIVIHKDVFFKVLSHNDDTVNLGTIVLNFIIKRNVLVSEIKLSSFDEFKQIVMSDPIYHGRHMYMECNKLDITTNSITVRNGITGNVEQIV